MKNKSKVILLPCNSYREELVYDSLKKGLKLLGGLEALILKDEKILLKPNLLKRAEVEKAVITHPAVVGMFGKLLKEEGYERGDTGRFLRTWKYHKSHCRNRNGHVSSGTWHPGR